MLLKGATIRSSSASSWQGRVPARPSSRVHTDFPERAQHVPTGAGGKRHSA